MLANNSRFSRFPPTTVPAGDPPPLHSSLTHSPLEGKAECGDGNEGTRLRMENYQEPRKDFHEESPRGKLEAVSAHGNGQEKAPGSQPSGEAAGAVDLAADFLSRAIAKNVSGKLDWNRLRLEPDILKQEEIDPEDQSVVYSVPFRGGWHGIRPAKKNRVDRRVYILLVSKREITKEFPSRLACYCEKIHERQLALEPGNKCVQWPLPVILYDAV